MSWIASALLKISFTDKSLICLAVVFMSLTVSLGLWKNLSDHQMGETWGSCWTLGDVAVIFQSKTFKIIIQNSSSAVRFPMNDFLLVRFNIGSSWWHHQLATFSALLAICAGNSPVTGEFPAQRPVTRSFDVFFDLRLTKWLSGQWWFETPSRSSWGHCIDVMTAVRQQTIA